MDQTLLKSIRFLKHCLHDLTSLWKQGPSADAWRSNLGKVWWTGPCFHKLKKHFQKWMDFSQLSKWANKCSSYFPIFSISSAVNSIGPCSSSPSSSSSINEFTTCFHEFSEYKFTKFFTNISYVWFMSFGQSDEFRNWCWMSNICYCYLFLTAARLYNLGHIKGIIRVH